MHKCECLDDESGNVCTQFFIFRPRNHTEVEVMLGVEMPKIMKGWRHDGHLGTGNSLLDSTDTVSEVGTPFESKEYDHNKRYHPAEEERHTSDNNPRMDFWFVIGFSKRTLNKMLKEAGYEGSCSDSIPERKRVANTSSGPIMEI